ncbi:male sterility protein-domain-containing protein [Mycena maculata]|uniref:Fatty acyl-CoA reductase n=1 Tax=Mycena maculata TaxID=230809 RepID=A0AAD7JK01_9AGAR|nr:male sterility protein-domain-containing protein [Mycena maculata]
MQQFGTSSARLAPVYTVRRVEPWTLFCPIYYTMHSTPVAFFQHQTIFLTGGTGSLGGCLLFKLAMRVDTQGIYVLVRGSEARAKVRWASTMPAQIGPMLATGKIQLVVGDTKERDCGIAPAVLAEMAGCVTLVIHCAANISLKAPLKQSVFDNCIPTLALAQLAGTFPNLSKFVHVSTAYANTFLPDGVVEEKIYPVGDPERHLSDIVDTGSITQKDVPEFTWPYGFAKHLTECLLSRNPRLPLLIVRPTTIASAISEPYPHYSPPGACPMSTYIRIYMAAPDSGVFRVTSSTADNVVDEIPVDLVANLLLLHVAHGTTGIVHAGAQSYVPRTLGQLHATILAHIPRPERLPQPPFQYVTDARIEEGRYATFWRALGRDWNFSTKASEFLTNIEGPLSIRGLLDGHDAAAFMDERARLVAREIADRPKHKSKL